MFCPDCGGPMIREPRGDTYVYEQLYAVAYRCVKKRCDRIILYKVLEFRHLDTSSDGGVDCG